MNCYKKERAKVDNSLDIAFWGCLIIAHVASIKNDTRTQWISLSLAVVVLISDIIAQL